MVLTGMAITGMRGAAGRCPPVAAKKQNSTAVCMYQVENYKYTAGSSAAAVHVQAELLR